MSKRSLARPVKLLAFWPASDFGDYFTPTFLHRSDIEVEIVSGDRTSSKSPYAADGARLRDLKKRVRAKEFDLVLSGNVWNCAWPPHKQLATKITQAARFLLFRPTRLDTYWGADFARVAAKTGVPFITLDLRDPSFVYPWDLPLLRESFLYYKRELFNWPRRSLGPAALYYGNEIYDLENKLRPLTYGVHPTHIGRENKAFSDRDIDVFMSGMQQPLRTQVADQLEKLTGEFNIVIHREKISPEDYINYLSRSKLVVCVESFGCETWRMYEVSAYGGVPLISWPYAQNAFPFEPDKHAIYFSYIGDHLERQIRRALAQPEKLAQIAEASHAFTHEYKDRHNLGTWVIENTLAEFHARKK